MTDQTNQPDTTSRLEALLNDHGTNKVRELIAAASPHPFQLTEPMKARIVALASLGLNLNSMAKALGMNRDTFWKWRKEYPGIDECIAEGRMLGAARVIELSWSAAQNTRDNARNQELARLHRIFKTEEVQGEEGTDETGKREIGFTVTIVEKDKATLKPDKDSGL